MPILSGKGHEHYYSEHVWKAEALRKGESDSTSRVLVWMSQARGMEKNLQKPIPLY